MHSAILGNDLNPLETSPCISIHEINQVPGKRQINTRLALTKSHLNITYTVDIHFMTASFLFFYLRTLTSFYFIPLQAFLSVSDAGIGVLESKISFFLFCFVLFFFLFFLGG